jgi:hypothetical protein
MDGTAAMAIKAKTPKKRPKKNQAPPDRFFWDATYPQNPAHARA